MTNDKAPPSWEAETIAEHVHTVATLEMMRDKHNLPGLDGEIIQARQDLGVKINAQGLREVVTITHRATLLANGSAAVERKQGLGE